MKKRLFTIGRIFLLLSVFAFCKKGFSQTATVPYQFYLDANNNCNYDAGETLLYNLPGNITFTYMNTGASSVSTITSAGCGAPLTVINPSVPVNNSFSYSVTPTSYPTFSYNASCSAYTNLSYTTTNYLPVKTIDQMTDVIYYSKFPLSIFYGNITNNVFPVCFNLGTDSIYFSFYVDNIFSCNSTVASRTYSIYVDGTLFDQVTASGANSNVSGTKCTLWESYNSTSIYFYLQTQLPNGISNLGAHTFSIKTSMLYNSALAKLNYNCTLNSIPCTRVSGKFYADCNNNCVLDGPDGNVFSNVAAKVYGPAGYNSTAYPNNLGNFSCLLPYNINPYYITPITYSLAVSYTACSNPTITIPSGAATSSITFGYQIPTLLDANTSLIPAVGTAGMAVPASTYSVRAKVNNFQASSCSVTFAPNPGKLKVKLDKIFTYLNNVLPTPAPNLIVSGPNGDTLIWNISDFNYANITYSVIVSVSNTVTTGTPFFLNSFITPQTDAYNANNQDILSRFIGVPYDPNGKDCYATSVQSNGDIPFGTQDLYYTVNFQNVGTASAIDVKTLDTIDINLDLSTIEVLQSSFIPQLQVDNTSRQVIFYFKNINLPDSNSDEPGSHGFVRYKIKLNAGVPVNAIIKNRAHNYFDFNAPVPTNQTKNKLVLFAGINEIANANSIHLQPNPVNDKLFISSDNFIKEISVLNSLGQIILKQEVNDNSVYINMENLPKAFYLVSIHLNNGQVITKKVIKN